MTVTDEMVAFVNEVMEAHFCKEDLQKHVDTQTDLSYDVLEAIGEYHDRIQH